MECHSQGNVTKKECQQNLKVTQNERSLTMSLKMEVHSKWNITQNGMSLKTECHSKWKFTQNGISLKMDGQSKWNVTQNRNSLKM